MAIGDKVGADAAETLATAAKAVSEVIGADAADAVSQIVGAGQRLETDIDKQSAAWLAEVTLWREQVTRLADTIDALQKSLEPVLARFK